jgi:hypothetical protein
MIRYYFIGNETRGPELIKALEEKGGVNVREYLGDTNAVYYCNPDNDEIYYVDKTSHLGKFIINTFEEIKLPLFERGDRVLVRTFKSDVWREAIYSFTEVRNERKFYFVVGGCYFHYCIPFDINKLGKITDE